MGSPSELSLDYKPNAGHSAIPKELGDQQPHDLQAKKIEEFLSRLEEERLKIDAFKRELPLCMQLLNNAMEAYRQQLEVQNTEKGPTVLEEFIPLKQKTSADGAEKPSSPAPSEKASWMTSAQLWTQQAAGSPTSPKLTSESKQRIKSGGAFLPFTTKGAAASRGGCGASPGRSVTRTDLPELAFAPSEKAAEGCTSRSGGEDAAAAEQGKSGGGGGTQEEEQAGVASAATGGQSTTTTQRKARRCWSPDLHRRFVNALQMLGGSHTATPKQIRELMKVDGLTNDEVKSHLQKYRLHTRRPIPAPHSAAAGPQLVVLGGFWVPPEYAASAAAAGATAVYGAHPHAAAHYCAAAPVHPDFYHRLHQPLPAPALHHRGAVMAYKGGQHPEVDHKSGGQRSESVEKGEERGGEEEEGKSESTNWKGGDEKARPASKRDDDEDDSTGSDVTLKI